jgi:hypothetical protein
MFLGLLDPDRIHQSEVRIRIRILLSLSKNSKKNLDSYYFVISFLLFIFENNVNHTVNVPSKVISRKTPRIRIHTKMSWIRLPQHCFEPEPKKDTRVTRKHDDLKGADMPSTVILGTKKYYVDQSEAMDSIVMWKMVQYTT